MFDCVVLATSDATPAARTLATLVEGVVQGHVRRVLLMTQAASSVLTDLSDQAGCRLVVEPDASRYCAHIAAHLSTAHVLIMEAGAMPETGWTDLLASECVRRGPPRVDEALIFRPDRRMERVRQRLAYIFSRTVNFQYGALVPLAVLKSIPSGRVGLRGIRSARFIALDVERSRDPKGL